MSKNNIEIIRAEYLPVALLFFMIGIGLSTTWKWEFEFWNTVTSIGSFLAGIGTMGLLILGLITAKNWKHQIELDKKLAREEKLINELLKEVESAHKYYFLEFTPSVIHNQNSLEDKLMDQFLITNMLYSKLENIYVKISLISYTIPGITSDEEVKQLDNLSKELIYKLRKILKAFNAYSPNNANELELQIRNIITPEFDKFNKASHTIANKAYVNR